MRVNRATIVIVVLLLHGNGFGANAERDDVVRKRVVPIMFSRSNNLNSNVIECRSDSIEEFPNLFTPDQRRNGAILLSIATAIYCFTAIAIICDNYFLPCVERLCSVFKLSEDVAAATFMSVATSAPELFVNIIGTFVTQSDIGIGTVVGSSMFNTLGVASLGGLFASQPIQLDWYPLTRDTVIYIMAILLLVSITWDGKVHWYEGLVLFVAYFVYFSIMFKNECISNFFKKLVKKLSRKKVEPVKKCPELSTVTCTDGPIHRYVEYKEEKGKDEEKDEDAISIFQLPQGPWYSKVYFFATWPIRLALFCTIPDPNKHKKLFLVTFLMCIIWIGSNSYMVSWMITVIGYTFGIQDSVLGLSFLAAGGCLPEAVSITIKSKKGEGAMGVSNALGANTMNILLSLGLPWFIKTTISAVTKDENNTIKIESGSIEYTILALIMVAFTLYVTLCCNRFRLSRINGMILMLFYTFFVILAIVMETVLFETVACNPSGNG